jgi:hypothetical protein
MDSLVDDGFILLGGPLEGGRHVLHIVDAPSKEVVYERFGDDNWHRNGMLRIKSIKAWTVLLDALQQ